jgi:hypothetical protein
MESANAFRQAAINYGSKFHQVSIAHPRAQFADSNSIGPAINPAFDILLRGEESWMLPEEDARGHAALLQPRIASY